MSDIALGVVGLGLGHPLAFCGRLSHQGYAPSALVFDASQPEECQRAEQLQQTYPGMRVFDDVPALLRAGVDAVICSAQAHRHLDVCAPLIEAKVPLYIDKPLAPDYARARRILDLVDLHDAPAMSCSVRRFSASYMAVFDHIRQGKIGTVLFVECYEPHGIKPGYWQDVKRFSGGLAVNYGVHVVDPIVAALGPDARCVSALAAKRSLPDVDSEDTAILHTQFGSGAIAIGKVSGGYRFGQDKPVPSVGHFIAHGSEGALETYIDESDVKVYRGGNFGRSDFYGTRSGIEGALAAFDGMVRTGKRPIALEEMDAVMRILDGARRSIDSGQTVRVDSAS